jgi:hypothetical protein
MSYTNDNYRGHEMLRGRNLRPVIKRLLVSAWNIFKSFVINTRDVLGSGRINL